MTTTTRNEPAERLRNWPDSTDGSVTEFHALIRLALAAERRATVERIRAAVAVLPDTWTQLAEQERVYLVPQADLAAILDEEAAR